MNLPFYIARRYLFSKKSHNAINVISMVSVCGVIVATIAMVCALSVFNGFSDLVSSLFSHFDPELKVMPTSGKVFNPNTATFAKLKEMPEIMNYSEVLEDNALIRYRDRQAFTIIKGVDAQYSEITEIEQILIDGRYVLREDVVDYATLGIGLAAMLGVNAGFVSPIELFVPKRDEPVNMVNPVASFEVGHAYIGGVFSTNQTVYDENYMIVPLELARSLFRYENEVSALELKLTENVDISAVKRKIKELVGKDFFVQDRYEQQADSFKMMQIEKFMTFLILCFILSIALFNIVGSLSMLMIEKQKDIQTLRNMGADDKLIRRIFLFEGWMISGIGTIIGIVIGVILSLLQQEFGLIRLGSSAEAFIIDAYPVRVEMADLIMVFFTVALMGFLAAWYSIRFLGKRWLVSKPIEQ